MRMAASSSLGWEQLTIFTSLYNRLHRPRSDTGALVSRSVEYRTVGRLLEHVLERGCRRDGHHNMPRIAASSALGRGEKAAPGVSMGITQIWEACWSHWFLRGGKSLAQIICAKCETLDAKR